MLYDPAFAIPHLVSILVATGFLVAALRRPPLARKLYLGLFVYAAITNLTVAIVVPASYVSNARYALLPFYRAFIQGWFAAHVQLVVTLIAVGQATIALGLVRGDRYARLGLVFAIVFFVAIAPMGVGSAFPSSLVWAAGALVLLAPRRQHALEGFAWRRLGHHHVTPWPRG